MSANLETEAIVHHACRKEQVGKANNDRNELRQAEERKTMNKLRETTRDSHDWRKLIMKVTRGRAT